MKEDLVCRGFFDKYKDDIQSLRMAQRLGVIEEVTVSNTKEAL